MIIALRTDKPEAEIGLFNPDGTQKSYYTWPADRELANQLLRVIHNQLVAQHADFAHITGVVVFQGPGSFTGLRIGITVANTLAYALQVPIVAAQGNNWLKTGVHELVHGKNDTIVLPFYGAEANITMPKQ